MRGLGVSTYALPLGSSSFLGPGSSRSSARHLHRTRDQLLPPSSSPRGADRRRQEGGKGELDL